MYEHPSARLRELRLERGLSQEVLARLSNVSRPTIHRVENGQQKAQERTLHKLACALDVSPEEIDPERFCIDENSDEIGVEVTNDLIAEYRPIIRAQAWRAALNPSDVDDLENAGLIGLYEAARSFDSRKNVPLDYWIKFISQNRIRDERRRIYKGPHPGYGLDNQNIEPWTY